MTIQETDARPAMLTVAGATAYSGFSRSRLYVEMAAGKLDVRRAGRRTLITRESVDALLAALPRAVATNRPGARRSP